MSSSADGSARRGYFVIPARVEPGQWEAFNRWYRDVHLPDAARRLKASNAFRLHRIDRAHVHVAVYELDDVARVRSEEFQQVLAALVGEFNAAWPSGVERERMFFEVCD